MYQNQSPRGKWNKEGLSDQWKEFVIAAMHKKGDKTDYNNYHGM
jgi:hypothetical protein